MSISLLFFFLVVPLKSGAYENLLINGGFEEIKDKRPAGWNELFWHYRTGTVYTWLSGISPFEKSLCLSLKNMEFGESQIIQPLWVSSATVYKITCMVKAKGVSPSGAGAYVGLRERQVVKPGVLPGTFGDMYGNYRADGGYSAYLYDSSDKWISLSATVKTTETQTGLWAVLGLGAYGRFSKGEVFFDNCSVTMGSVSEKNIYYFMSKTISNFLTISGYEARFVIYNTTIGAVFFVICLWGIKNRFSINVAGQALDVVFLAAFVLRILVTFYVDGYPYDIELFKKWALYIGEKGLGSYYSGEIFADYPPIYVYVLYVLQWLRRIFSIAPDSNLFMVLLKIPAITADLLSGLLIYKTAKQKGLDSSMSVVLSSLYLFNPAIIVNSSVWGQVDSVFTLVLALAVWLLVNGRIEKSITTFTLSILIKPQGLLLTPVYLWAFIYSKDKIRYFYSFIISIILFYAAFIPFYGKIDLIAPLTYFAGKFTQYPYAVNSAFNLYSLFDGMSVPEGSVFFFGISYKAAGLFIVLTGIIISLYAYSNKKDINQAYFTAFFLFSFFYVFATKMNSRYLYPSLIFAIFTFITTGDLRIMLLYAFFSLSMFVNDSHIQYLSVHSVYHVEFFTLFMKTVSALNIIAVLYLIYLYLTEGSCRDGKKV